MNTMLNLNNILKIINLFTGHTKVKKHLNPVLFTKGIQQNPSFISSQFNHQEANKKPHHPDLLRIIAKTQEKHKIALCNIISLPSPHI
ncbi:hypothetical protein BBM19_16795 [Vibrio parahaemolyticus]|nr:hypothetical protein BBM19_16795 [Vibrio parahaemolyticus]